jgi:hypothetical protein
MSIEFKAPLMETVNRVTRLGPHETLPNLHFSGLFPQK